jgi:hypothetical protein
VGWKTVEPPEEMGIDGRSSSNGFRGNSIPWLFMLNERIILKRILQK